MELFVHTEAWIRSSWLLFNDVKQRTVDMGETVNFRVIKLNTIKYPRNAVQTLVTNSAPQNILALIPYLWEFSTWVNTPHELELPHHLPSLFPEPGESTGSSHRLSGHLALPAAGSTFGWVLGRLPVRDTDPWFPAWLCSSLGPKTLALQKSLELFNLCFAHM